MNYCCVICGKPACMLENIGARQGLPDRLEGKCQDHAPSLCDEAIHAAVAAEREACAKVAENIGPTLPKRPSLYGENPSTRSSRIAAAIRARGAMDV